MAKVTLTLDVQGTLTAAELRQAADEAQVAAVRALLQARGAGGGTVTGVTPIDSPAKP